MPALGLVMAWGGYWFLFYGLLLKRGGAVTLLETALPSQRAAVIAGWSGANPVTTATDINRQQNLNQAYGVQGNFGQPGTITNPIAPPAPYGGLPPGLGGPVAPGSRIGR